MDVLPANLHPAALAAHWSRLSDPWQLAFSLGWEAFQAGSFPVGAVILDAGGSVVSSGRNRIWETNAPPGQVAGTNLAHAEVNALAQLPRGSYSDHTLLTTLEPCLLCSAAMRSYHIGRMEYAAPDPTWAGIERVPELNRHVAQRWAARVGPLDGPLAAWAALLPMLAYAEWPGAAAVAADYRAGIAPGLPALADLLASPEQLVRIRATPLADAFTLVAVLSSPAASQSMIGD